MQKSVSISGIDLRSGFKKRSNKRPFITGDGSQRRDMLHVEDAIAANIFAMNYKKDFIIKLA